MLTFRYIIYFLKGVFTARASLREAMSEDAFLDLLATRTGLTRPQCEDFLRKLFAILVELARQGIPVDFILDLFRLVPSLGGVYPDNNPAATLVRPHLSLSVVIHPSQLAAMQDNPPTPMEKVDEKTYTKPIVEHVHSNANPLIEAYGVGPTASTTIDGQFFRESRVGAPLPTVALVDAGGANPIALGIAYCTPTLLVVTGAPAGTTGVKYIKVTDVEGRFCIYDVPLSPG